MDKKTVGAVYDRAISKGFEKNLTHGSILNAQFSSEETHKLFSDSDEDRELRIEPWVGFFSHLHRPRLQWQVLVCAALLLSGSLPGYAQGPGRGGRGGRGGAPSARQGAAMDLTGYWVSVISEDWEFRMVTPDKGVYDTLTLNAEGRRVGDTWDPARDEAAGEQCRSYGAGNIMRVPERLHVTWEDDMTLRIDTDAGMQTRLFHFGGAAPSDENPSWQGYSAAAWEYAGGGRGGRGGRRGGGGQARQGNLKVVTTHLRPGYVRKNGAPYSDQAVVTEYYDINTLPNGEQWLTVTTEVDDPVYFSRPYITTSDFKKLSDASGWNPTPCSAR